MACKGDVTVLGSEFYLIGSACNAVREMGRATRFHAHGMELGHLFGQREQLRHGAKRHPFVVQVESRDDDAVALVGQVVAHLGEVVVEELGLVDRHNGIAFRPSRLPLAGRLNVVPQGLAAWHNNGRHGVFVVAHNFDVVVTRVGGRLEQRHGELGDVGAADATEELFGFAGEHGAAHDF